MSFNWRRPKPDAFGSAPVILSVGPLGGSNLLYTTAPLVTQGSITFTIGTPFRKMWIRGANTHASTLVGTSGTTVAKVQKLTGGTVTTAITGNLNLATGAAYVTNKFTMGTASTIESDRIIKEGELLQVVVVNTGTLVTEPVELYFNIEAFSLE